MNRTLTALCLAAALAFAALLQPRETRRTAYRQGLQCQTCHGPDMKNPQMPEMATCTGCHNVDQLVEKTKNVKPVNPHVSPHYGKTLECTNCHLMHQESENYCNQCHEFNFKVP